MKTSVLDAEKQRVIGLQQAVVSSDSSASSMPCRVPKPHRAGDEAEDREVTPPKPLGVVLPAGSLPAGSTKGLDERAGGSFEVERSSSSWV